MDFDFGLPFWAVIYAGLILANGLATLMLSLDRSLLYRLAEILATLFAISFFFMYYGGLPKPQSLVIPVLMLLFILFQEIVVNKPLYRSIIHKAFPKEDPKHIFTALVVMSLIFLIPFFVIVVEVLASYLKP